MKTIKVTHKPSFFSALKSAASAMIGIQKSDKHSSDFNSDTPFPFILAGVILVIGFILALITIVNFVVG